MMAPFKAEVRKLLTVRSTYVILALALLCDAFFAGFVKGYKLDGAQLLSPYILQTGITTAVSLTAIFGALIAVLLVTHEYRYSTILYSLTVNRSRTLFLAAKIVAVTFMALFMTVFISLCSPLFTLIGTQLAGHDLPVQSIFYSDIGWRVLFYGWGYAMIALLIGALVRNQIGAILSLFVLPGTVEGLLSLVLKDNSSYLPFSALGSVMDKSVILSYAQAAGVFSLYLVAGWLITWILFLRKDAN